MEDQSNMVLRQYKCPPVQYVMPNLSFASAMYAQNMNITCLILSNKIGNCSERICKLLFESQIGAPSLLIVKKRPHPLLGSNLRPRSEHSTLSRFMRAWWIRSARVRVNLCVCVCVLIYYNGLPLFTGFISPGRKGSFIVLCSGPLLSPSTHPTPTLHSSNLFTSRTQGFYNISLTSLWNVIIILSCHWGISKCLSWRKVSCWDGHSGGTHTQDR